MSKHHSNPIISIIVPVYQVAPYLRECLDSIIGQSFTDWEMLLIDDGSTDGGELMCDEYGAREERIRVFHQENIGLSAALNLGLDNSFGEYIAMVDADDVLLSPDYLHILYDACKGNDAQVSICRMVNFNDGSPVPEAYGDPKKRTFLTGKDVFTKKPYCIDVNIFSTSCSKLYHKSCFEDVRYPMGRIMEDVAVFHRLIYPCSRIVLLEDTMYGRRIREGSITTGTKAALQYKDTLSAIEDRIAYFKERNDQEAVSYAIRRKTRAFYYYYFHALEDGSFDEISPEIRPDVADFENEVDYMSLLHSFRRIDPKHIHPHTIKYLSVLSNRAFQLLRISLHHMLHTDMKFEIQSSEADLLCEFATNEGLLPFAYAALDMSDEYIDKTVRSHILMQHALEKILSDSLSDDKGPTLTQLIPSEIMTLYTEPWLRCSGSRSFLADPEEMDRIGSLMKRHGFTYSNTGPLEEDPLHSVSFKNKDNIELKMIFDLPPTVSGTCREYLNDLFTELIRERREMTITEYTLFLISKLHLPNIRSLSTRLCDLLDLALILHAYPEQFRSESFCKKEILLISKEDWDPIKSICTKAVSYSSDPISLQKEELIYLIGFIIGSLK